MERSAWKRARVIAAVAAVVAALAACTSHPLVRASSADAALVVAPPDAPADSLAGEPRDIPDVPPDCDARQPPPAEDAADAGSDTSDLATDRADATVDRAPGPDASGGLELVSWIQSVGGTPIRVLKQDRYVFLGDWENMAVLDAGYSSQSGSIQTYDVSDPKLPVLRSTVFTPEQQVQDMAIDGHWLFVANDALGLRLVDISQPEALRSVANRPNGPLFATSVAIATRATDAGSQLYALAGYLYGGGLDIHAVPDGGPIPNPVHYTSAALPGRCDVHQIQVRDNRAYILASDGETQGCFEILDVSGLPAVPVAMGRLCLPFASLGGIGDIRVAGDWLYFSASNWSGAALSHVGGLRIISLEDEAHPDLVASLDLPPNAGQIPWKGTGLALAGSEVFFITSSGLQAIDVSDPSHPTPQIAAPFPAAFGTCQGGTAVADGDLLYVGAYCHPPAGRGGLAIYRRR
jgi:hypothetical protein